MYATDINLLRKNKACISWNLCCLHTGIFELHQKEYSGIQHWQYSSGLQWRSGNFGSNERAISWSRSSNVFLTEHIPNTYIVMELSHILFQPYTFLWKSEKLMFKSYEKLIYQKINTKYTKHMILIWLFIPRLGGVYKSPFWTVPIIWNFHIYQCNIYLCKSYSAISVFSLSYKDFHLKSLLVSLVRLFVIMTNSI